MSENARGAIQPAPTPPYGYVPESYVRFVTTTYDRVLHVVAAAYGSGWHDAQDAVHDAYIKALERWDPPDDDDKLCEHPKPAGWVVTTAKQLCRDHAQRQQHQPERLARAQAAIHHPTMGNPEETAPSLVTQGLLDGPMFQALTNLPPRQREVFALHHVGGWPSGQIARLLKLAPSTVSTHLKLARKKLRKHLSPGLDDDEKGGQP